MNDADRLIAIPEEIIFHSYILRIIDHLKFNYDPKFNKAWTNDEFCPDIFKEDVDHVPCILCRISLGGIRSDG